MRTIALVLPIVALSLTARAHADEPASAGSASAPVPAPAPAPVPVPAPVSAPDSVPVSAPVPAPVSAPDSAPDSVPAPVSAPDSAPAATSVPVSADEDLPLRLRDMLRLEADRARAARYFNGTLSVLGSAGVIGAGAYSLSTAQDTDVARKDVSYLIIGTGGLGLLSAVFGLFGQTPLERLYESYAPFAEDAKFSAAQRLQEGEDALRQMAANDESSRRIGGITNIVAGVLFGGVAVFFAASSTFTDSDRVVLGTITGVSSLAAIGSGIGALWFQRGTAEIALEHWEASRGLRRQAGIQWTPSLTPTRGGAMGGVSLSF